MEQNYSEILLALYICLQFSGTWLEKLADDNTIDYQWTSGCIFLQQLIDIISASDTGLESESQNDDDTEQSTEVDNMMDVGLRARPMMWPISNRNGLVHDLIILTFRAEYVLKQNIVRKNDILFISPVK